jgi:hypothetical protein
MTTLAELIADVTALTKRPDLVDRTTRAIKAATLKAHSTDFYLKDTFEYTVSFGDPSAKLQIIDYTAVSPRWRAVWYLRDFTGNVAGKLFDKVSPNNILDGFSTEKSNVFYLSGTVYQIKSSGALSKVLLGAYLHPEVSDGGYSSWIADEVKQYIVLEAAAKIASSIGQADMDMKWRKEAHDEWLPIIMANDKGDQP